MLVKTDRKSEFYILQMRHLKSVRNVRFWLQPASVCFKMLAHLKCWVHEVYLFGLSNIFRWVLNCVSWISTRIFKLLLNIKKANMLWILMNASATLYCSRTVRCGVVWFSFWFRMLELSRVVKFQVSSFIIFHCLETWYNLM